MLYKMLAYIDGHDNITAKHLGRLAYRYTTNVLATLKVPHEPEREPEVVVKRHAASHG